MLASAGANDIIALLLSDRELITVVLSTFQNGVLISSLGHQYELRVAITIDP